MGSEVTEINDTSESVIALNDDVDELDREREEVEGTEEPGEESTDAETDDEETPEEKDDAEEESDESSDGTADEAVVDTSGKEEITSLRQMIRAQRLQMRDLEAKMEKQTEALVQSDILPEDDAGEEDQAAAGQRAEVLDQMVELMELNPKFEDVKDVCSQSNFDDVSELLAKAYVAEHGGNAEEVADEIAVTIWAKTNPYKEMYKLVKDYHPDFAEKKSESKRGDVLEKAKKGKEAAAPSLSNMPSSGGKSAGGSGWTAQRIDQLTEDELTKVPSDVYEKYMLGDLD